MTQTGLREGAEAQIPSSTGVSSLAYIPFRVVYAPTARVGRAVAWLAAGYRDASPLERALILPTWAILRGVFLVGCGLANLFYGAARRSLEN
jgi:hypothetical protein